MTIQNYTVDMIVDRLEQAVHTMRRMPRVTVRGYASSWPETVREFNESYGYNQTEIRLGAPSSKYITEMDEACRWLLWLEKHEVKIIWARSAGMRWKTISSRVSFCSIRKAQNDYKIGIIKISENLKRSAIPNPVKDPLPYKERLNSAYAF